MTSIHYNYGHQHEHRHATTNCLTTWIQLRTAQRDSPPLRSGQHEGLTTSEKTNKKRE